MNNTGDTIVEVLIAITIISTVLTGAYISANRSFNNSRQSQEKGEAIKVAETQLEKIKAYASDPAKNVYNSVAPAYCFDATDNTKVFTSPGYSPVATLEADNFSTYPVECQFFSYYNVAIKYTPPSPPFDDYFTIKVRWDRLGGNRDEIIMLYRLHQ